MRNRFSGNPGTNTAYFQQFLHGTFGGILRWEQLDDLWADLRARSGEGWYPYTLPGEPPRDPVSPEAFEIFLSNLDTTLRKLQHRDHCGIVYADDRSHPTFVLIFHPHRIISCGGQDAGPAIPGWTLSLVPPVNLHTALVPPTKPGFLTRLRTMVGAQGLSSSL